MMINMIAMLFFMYTNSDYLVYSLHYMCSSTGHFVIIKSLNLGSYYSKFVCGSKVFLEKFGPFHYPQKFITIQNFILDALSMTCFVEPRCMKIVVVFMVTMSGCGYWKAVTPRIQAAVASCWKASLMKMSTGNSFISEIFSFLIFCYSTRGKNFSVKNLWM